VPRFHAAPHASGRRVNLRHALPSTRVFVAQDGARVVGTATVFQDSPLGLPMHEVFGDQLAAMRARGSSVAEISALAMDGDRRAYGLPVLMRLLRLLLLYSASVARLDDCASWSGPSTPRCTGRSGRVGSWGSPGITRRSTSRGAVAPSTRPARDPGDDPRRPGGSVPRQPDQAFIAGAAF
jgi:hypothetical protein